MRLKCVTAFSIVGLAGHNSKINFDECSSVAQHCTANYA